MQVNYAILGRMSYTIAVDVGGTQIRAGSYPSESLTPSRLERIATRHPSLSPLERVIEAISSVWPADEPVASIGIAAPGPVDPYAGIVREAPNIPGWNDLPMRKELEEHFQVPVALGNDANMAALGEWKYGAGKGHHYLIYLTVSTGIGGGVIVADQLLVGASGLAGEFGHITVDPNGPLCGCGHRGHLEAYASGPGMAKWVSGEIEAGVNSTLALEHPITAKAIGLAAEHGDELAIAALARSGEYIGRAVADFLHLFNPTAIIVGGGVSRTGHFLMDPMSTTMKANVISPYYLENLTLTTAALGDNAGLMGALALGRGLTEGVASLVERNHTH